MKTNGAILLFGLQASIAISLFSAGEDRNSSPLFAEGTGPLSALTVAAEAGSMGEVKRLLAAGEDPNARTRDKAANGAVVGGITPLYAAAVRGHVEVVQVLLDGGADIKRATTANGRTPLSEVIHTIEKDDRLSAMVKLLLERGGDPNQPHLKIGSVLHFAVVENKPEVVRQLVAARAKLDSRTRDGKTPLELAEAQQKPEMAELLKTLAKNKQTKESVDKAQEP